MFRVPGFSSRKFCKVKDIEFGVWGVHSKPLTPVSLKALSPGNPQPSIPYIQGRVGNSSPDGTRLFV